MTSSCLKRVDLSKHFLIHAVFNRVLDLRIMRDHLPLARVCTLPRRMPIGCEMENLPIENSRRKSHDGRGRYRNGGRPFDVKIRCGECWARVYAFEQLIKGTNCSERAVCVRSREGDVFHLLFTRCQGAAEGERSYRPSTRAVEARRESGIQSARRRYAWPYRL